MSSQILSTFHEERTLALVQKLTAAIQAGENDQATDLVLELASRRLKLDISVPEEEQELRNKEKEFNVKVHIEDRESKGFFINMMVKSCDSIADLKRKVMLKHNFPIEVQRWIIGKRLIENNQLKLSQCGVKTPGHTLYLYLVTARSVGLTRQHYDTQKQLYMQGVLPINHQSTLNRESSSEQSASWAAFDIDPMSYYAGEDQAQAPLLGSNSSGSVRVQEMLQTSLLGTLPHQNPVIDPTLVNTHSPNNGQPTMVNLPPADPPKEEPVGWQCPQCTYINLPLRPGCELCSGDRPADYVVPPNYKPTPEEQLLIEKEQQLERLTREASPNQVGLSGRITQEHLRESLRQQSRQLQAVIMAPQDDVVDSPHAACDLEFLNFSERPTSGNRSSQINALLRQRENRVNLPGFEQILPDVDGNASSFSDEEN